MCGIAGYIGHNSDTYESSVREMLEVQSHRGPDARGVKAGDGCVLGHVRLSIIDLTAEADQPFTSADGRWTVVFNGEIYNFIELKNQLEKKGVIFKTYSDTEVLLYSWVIWGEQCLQHFVGMFAFAIWDNVEKTLFCARDRFGIKPFHYSIVNDGLLFSSEIKPLFFAGIERVPDESTWATYLTTAVYDHSEKTFFKGVNRLLAGYQLIKRLGRTVEIKQYWTPPIPFSQYNHLLSYEDACEELQYLISDSIDLHLRSDVPRGLLLSGGVDSAVVLSSSHQAGFNDIKGFHYCFPEPYSELPWVKELIQHYRTDMSYYELSPDSVEEYFANFLWFFEEPFGSLVLMALGPLYATARANENIKVFLDGNGADDIFGGYLQHHVAYLSDLYLSGDTDRFGKEVNQASKNWGIKKSVFLEHAKSMINDNTQKITPDLTMSTAGQVLEPEIFNTDIIPVKTPVTESQLSKHLLLGLTQTKIPRNTRFDDHLSMAYSLEQRVPMLDHRLSEFVAKLSPDFLFHKGFTKSILRDSMRNKIPNNVLYAPKRHIQSPQIEWMGRPLEKFMKSIITSKSFQNRGYVNSDKALKYYNNYLNSKPTNSFALWQWVNLEIWHRTFIDSSLSDLKQHPKLLYSS